VFVAGDSRENQIRGRIVMMKKTLMGTTALVAVAVAVSGARADEMMAEPVSLSIGGNSHWGVAVFDNEAAPNSDDIALSNDVELRFAGKTVLDSGIEVGIRIEIEGEQSGDQGDETYAYLEGSFGTVRIGNDDTAAYSMGTAAPYATYFYGLNTPYWAGTFSSGSWMSTFAGTDVGDSASLMYFSPVINGFQFGVSFAPEAGAEARSGTASTAEGSDVYSIGARYDGAFGDAGVTVAGGYVSQDVPATAAVAAMPHTDYAPATMGSDAAAGRTVTDWAAGVVVSMSGVSVGSSYRVTDDDQGNDDTTSVDVGIMYGDGPWAVSLNWGNRSNEDAADDTDFARLLANYNIGPGINLAGAIGNDSTDAGDTTFAGVALAISF
jgi:outer membrane protein OmpU